MSAAQITVAETFEIKKCNETYRQELSTWPIRGPVGLGLRCIWAVEQSVDLVTRRWALRDRNSGSAGAAGEIEGGLGYD